MPNKEIKINDAVWYRGRNGLAKRATVVGFAYVLEREDGVRQTIHADNVYVSVADVPGAVVTTEPKQLTLDDAREKSFIKSLCDLVKKYTQGEE